MDLTKFYGLYRGIVVDNRDPNSQRRVKVQVAGLGNQIFTWAWPLETSSLKTLVPSIGQGVWVEFEGGDSSYPIWVGVFGKNVNTGRHVMVKPLPVTTSLTGIADQLILTPGPNSTTEVDLVATLLAMATKLNALKVSYDAYVAAHP